ncbi:MFS transporter [Paenibacillus sp. UMB7766-LJ446]|uniref:MFS transporter n=1 Tax=Paenibacillus sp. UMB7766-LJ446 TaxID=3046313 RepID=UPI002550A277|nr:MFS transporter [Paenibacillus sp. UMB7766-LJ446]MDK8193160.1 MFS transporter [Paenibacillus sp. UMB7766-LJ446]
MSKFSFPLLGLVSLTMAGFIATMTETLPAGLLPKIAQELNISESLAGQLVTLYGLGSLIAAVPVALATQSWRRRPLLLLTLTTFLIFNTFTAISTNYVFILVSRFIAGVAAGVVWGMIAGYGMRMVSEQLKGRATAIVLAGTPIALSLGVPAGTFLGELVSWRIVFCIMSVLSLIVIGLVLWKVPDFPGQEPGKRTSVAKLFRTPGVPTILFVILVWMLAHNIIYSYIAPFLGNFGLQRYTGLTLLIFGFAALISVWLIGALIDRWLRLLVIVSLVIFAVSSLLLAFYSSNIIVVFLSAGLWGLSFGGSATLLQTALAQATGEKAIDIAIPMSATFWNIAIAGGGAIGGIILDGLGAKTIPWAIFILIMVALIVSWIAKNYAFVKVKVK